MSVGVTSPCRPRVVPARKATTTQVTTTPTQQDTRCEYGISAPYPATNTRSFDIKFSIERCNQYTLIPPSLPSFPSFASHFRFLLPSLSLHCFSLPVLPLPPFSLPFLPLPPPRPAGSLACWCLWRWRGGGKGEGGHSRSFLQVIFYSWFLFYRLLTAL